MNNNKTAKYILPGKIMILMDVVEQRESSWKQRERSTNDSLMTLLTRQMDRKYESENKR